MDHSGQLGDKYHGEYTGYRHHKMDDWLEARWSNHCLCFNIITQYATKDPRTLTIRDLIHKHALIELYVSLVVMLY